MSVKKVTLDFHEARSTRACTRWYLLLEEKAVKDLSAKGRLIYSSKSHMKTHWSELWLFPMGTTLVRKRVSNRGNLYLDLYKVSEKGLEHVRELSAEEVPEELLQ